MKTLALLFFCALAAAKDLRNNINPKAYSPAGIYEGTIMKSQLGKDISAFRGIPYAQPPTGELRFKPPIKVAPHQGIYDATEEGPICPQLYEGDLIESEDCLRLNVYTNELPQNSSDGSSINPKKPVIVYIHGGAFSSLSGSSFHFGPQVLLDANIVLVTINYRLGALGWLSTGDPRAPGNAGLKDQVLALKWVQENIAAFGGNPDRVTIMGQGAGSTSASLHIVSPMSKGLFHGAILVSGAGTPQFRLPSYEDELVKRTAHGLQCPTDSVDDMFACFYSKPAEEFVKIAKEFADVDRAIVPTYIPVMEPKTFGDNINEEAFLTEQPNEIIIQGKANFVPIKIGVARDECGFLAIQAEEQAQQGNSTLYDEFNNNWNEMAPKRFGYNRGVKVPVNVSIALKEAYLKNGPLKAGNYQGLANLYADSAVIFRVHRLERLMATYSTKPVYYYLNSYENCDTFAKWSNGTRFGVVHGDDLFTFSIVNGPTKHCARNPAIDSVADTLISNFATFGNPTPETEDGTHAAVWQPSTKDQPKYLEFKGQDYKMVDGVIYPERMAVWDKLFPWQPNTNESPVVNSPAGAFLGSIMKSQLGKNIYAYRGIPYAQPPTGSNRFIAPIPIAPHQGIYDATEEGPICPQLYEGDLTVSEDCLRLNVYTNESPQNTKKPVIVFIHGGGYISSSGSSHHFGPQVLLDANILLVTMNYRLGALGWLSTDDPRAPGNAGLKDQVLALKWVQENIEAFGGDPNKVTVMGLGAGSQSVSYHILSPMSKGLFHRAVMISGAATTQSSLLPHEDEPVKKTAQTLGCSVDNVDDMFNCFYSKSWEEFIEATKKVTDVDGAFIPLHIPVKEPKTFGNINNDNAFITELPYDIITQGKFNAVPLVLGVSKHEFEYLITPAEEQAQQGNCTLYDNLTNNWNEIAPKRFGYNRGHIESSVNISETLKSFYIEKPLKAGNYQGLAKLYADSLTIFQVHRFHELMVAHSPEPVYYYRNDYENCDTSAKWSNGTHYGVVHNDDAFTLFIVNGPTKHCSRNPAVDSVADTLISNFATFGNPTPESEDGTHAAVWQPSTKDHPKYLEFKGQDYKMVDGVIYPERMAVWDKLFPWQPNTNESPVVNSPAGAFLGSIMKTQMGKNIYAYRGIPYAQPPTGSNRFTAPIPTAPHQGIYNASEEGPICPQSYEGDLIMSEDCLRLNVYTNDLSQNPKKPVIVFIPGGAFISSSGSSYHYGPQILLDSNVVLVTMNYRLGAFGLLSSSDKRAPGNAALKDQVLALKWVKQNIGAFGGDPNLVTIVGQGAGAASASLHIVSPMSKGLFHSAVMISGAVTYQNPLPSVQDELVEKIAQTLGCPVDKVDDMFNCLYTKPWEEYVKANEKLMNISGSPIPIYLPVIEKKTSENDKEAFITEQPTDIISGGKANFVPLSLGVTKDEFGYKVMSAIEQAQQGNSTLLDKWNNNWDELAPKYFGYEIGTPKSFNISAELKEFYMKNGTLSADNYQGLANLCSDALAIFHVYKFERLMATYSPYPVYLYKNIYENCDTFAKWSNGTRFGVVHNDDAYTNFVVNGPTKHCGRNHVIDALAGTLMSNFALFGNPTPGIVSENPSAIWQPSTKNHPKYLEFNGEHYKMVDGVIYPERMALWDKLFPWTLGNNESPVVNTPIGSFRGSIMKSQLGRNIYAYRGIPYAQPPTGSNRFTAPIPTAPHQGIYDATGDGPICPQLYEGPFIMSEDCLNLNVYTTTLPQNSSEGSMMNPKKPVMVYIHGGAYTSSSASSHHIGPQLLLDGDFVLVTMNYRLGALGFFSSGDARAPGNAGLKDQVLALKWIQQNIEAFGGDPNLVTLSGHGSGSSCISLHIVSPMSKGLFHRAIMKSGAGIYRNPLSYHRDDLVKNTAQAIGCPTDSVDNMFNCFYKKPANEFVELSQELTNIYGPFIPIYSPAVEQLSIGNVENIESFLTEQPIKIITEGKANYVPACLGIHRDEFGYLIIPAEEQAQQGNSTLYDEWNNKWDELAPKYFGYESGTPRSSYISKVLKDFYLKNETLRTGKFQGLAQLYSDAFAIHHVHRYERLMATYSPYPVYFYQNNFEESDTFARWSNGTRFGVVHNDDTINLFSVGGPMKPSTRSPIRTAALNRIFWNFAKTGNPTPENANGTNSFRWEPSTKDQPQYLDYNSDGSVMVKGVVYPERMAIWDKLFPWQPNTNESPVVNSPIGSFRGSIMKTQMGKNIYAYRGIPYAQPPTGSNRFTAPIPIEPHQGIYNATEEGPICPQLYEGDLTVSENCLRLNVYTTGLTQNSTGGSPTNSKKSVIVYIPGGKYVSLSGSSFHVGPQILLDANIVLVTMNYRLGAFGWLSSGDSRLPGNAGLKDQVLALKWIQQNIEAFGGDPKSVTMIGLGAGAASASLHIVSPMSKGLFHRAIMISGVATYQYPTKSYRDDLVNATAQIMGCPVGNIDDTLNCFYTKPWEEFVKANQELTNITGSPIPIYEPVIEKKTSENDKEAFLTEQPTDIISEGKANFVPIIVGVAKDELGYLVIPAVEQAQQGNLTLLNEWNIKWEELAPKYYGYKNGTSNQNHFSGELKEFYIKNGTLSADNYQGLANFFSDSIFTFPVHKFERLMSTYSPEPVYVYKNIYENCDTSAKWSNGTRYGVVHNDEEFILFIVNGPTKHCGRNLAIDTMNIGLASNFASSGDPTPESKVGTYTAVWQPSTKDHPKYLEYNGQDYKMVDGVIYPERMAVWDKLFPWQPNTNESPVVNSPIGSFRGSIMKTQMGKNIYAYRGIPYAQPPTGSNRFTAPIPIAPHQGIYNATEEGPICPQFYEGDLTVSEDCLRLNVYINDLSQNQKKPVIVFIPGGAFISSSGSSFHYGPQVLLDSNVVLVTMNYRLGAFGLLSSGDSHAPGNAALKDQVLALKWVKQNIGAFGGDPDSITLIGQGAGAASVSLHIVSPMSKGLFHRAIMMGGAVTYQNPLPSTQDNFMKETAQTLGCPVDKIDDMFNCFNTKPWEEFVKANKELTNIYQASIPIYRPVIEKKTSENDKEAFLTEQPTDIISEGKANYVPIIAGVTKDEFGYLVMPAVEQAQQGNFTLFNKWINKWEEVAPKYYGQENGTPNSNYISGELKKFYMKNGTFSADNYQGLANFFADSMVMFHMHKFERLMSTYSPEPVYIYNNNYENCDTFEKWSNGTRYGVVHNDDVFSLFIVNGPTKHCGRNLAIDSLNIGMASDFASSGNPTPESKLGTYAAVWQPSTKDHPKYLKYNGEDYKMVDGVIYPERMAVWEKLFPWQPNTNESPVVNSPTGAFRGSIMKTQLGKNIYAYRGIPYAQPPTGPNRFIAPIPTAPHQGIYDATEDGPMCPQLNKSPPITSEDCLNLNVYTTTLPQNSSNGSPINAKKPVIVYIPGNGFVSSSGSSYDLGPQILLDANIVLVTFNYRLGAFGWLSSSDKRAPGNAALKDQVLVLKWVQQNIGAFGGDSTKVTLMGQGAGSISVSFHIVSPLSKGLFHRAFMMSGGATPQTPFPSCDNELVKRTAKGLGCPTDSIDDMFTCFYSKPAEEFVKIAKEFADVDGTFIPTFTPVIEPKTFGTDNNVNAFITEQPIDIISNRKANWVPLYIGNNKDELGYLVIQAEEQAQQGNSTLYDEWNNNWNEIAPKRFGYNMGIKVPVNVSIALKEAYLKNGPLKAGNYQGLANLHTDSLTTVQVHRFERLMATYSTQPVYYYFSVYENCETMAKWSNGTRFGVVHYDEAFDLFIVGGVTKGCERNHERDAAVRELISDFAETGNPIPDSKADKYPIKWQPSTKDQAQYIVYNNDWSMVQGSIYEERMKIWDELFPLPLNK